MRTRPFQERSEEERDKGLARLDTVAEFLHEHGIGPANKRQISAAAATAKTPVATPSKPAPFLAESSFALTNRQHEILQMVASGLDDKTIADRLSISYHTVKEIELTDSKRLPKMKKLPYFNRFSNPARPLAQALLVCSAAAAFWPQLHSATLPPDPAAVRGISLFDTYAAIHQSEYEIHWQDGADTYQTPNRANNLRFTFWNDGVTAELRDKRHGDRYAPPDDWHVRISLDTYGKANARKTERASRTTLLERNQARFDAEGIAFEYVNDTQGLHQSFLVKQPSPGWGDDALVIDLAVSTSADLGLALDDGGDSVSFFKRNGGARVMRYAGLKVLDSTGRELASQMALDAREHILLIIDDRNAQYPLLVDPWLLADTLSLSTGQAHADFGHSVAYMERALDTGGSVEYFGSVIIGAPYFDDGLTDQGKAFVYYGTSTGLVSQASWTAKGDQEYANLGYSVAAADPFDSGLLGKTLNDDSFADLVVGEWDYSTQSVAEVGRVFVWYGDSNGLGTDGRSADRTYTGSVENELMGSSVTTGEITGDDYMDVIVGAPGAGSGKIYVIKGSSTGLPSSPTQTISGPSSGSQFGASVAYADMVLFNEKNVVVGARNYNNGYGAVYLYTGASGGLNTTPSWSYTGAQAGAQLGSSVSGSRHMDVDGDGQRDLIVGEPLYDGASTTNEGRVHVFREFSVSGGIYSAGSHDTLQGFQSGAQFGRSVGGGRFNEDGIADILIGAPFYDTNSNDDKGRVFIFYGRSSNSPNPTPDQLTSGNGNLTGEHFGWSVAFVLKITSPFDEPCFIGGAPGADLSGVTDAGSAMIYQYDP